MRIKNVIPVLVAAQTGILLTGCSPKVTNAEELLAEYNKKERDNYVLNYYADGVLQEVRDTGTSVLRVQTLEAETTVNDGKNHSVLTFTDDGTVIDTYELYSEKNEETDKATEQGEAIDPGNYGAYKMFEEVDGIWEPVGVSSVPGAVDITTLPAEELKEASFVDSDGEFVLTIDATKLMETDFGRELVEGIDNMYDVTTSISTPVPGTVTITFDQKTLNIKGITVSGMSKTVQEGTESEDALSPDLVDWNIYYNFSDYGNVEEEMVMPE